MKIILNQKKINEEIKQYTDKLRTFTEEELCKIYHELNGYRWHDLLGEKPEDWGELPKSLRTLSILAWRYTRTKARIIDPIAVRIECIVGDEKLLEWHWVNNMRMTIEEGHQFIKERARMKERSIWF